MAEKLYYIINLSNENNVLYKKYNNIYVDELNKFEYLRVMAFRSKNNTINIVWNNCVAVEYLLEKFLFFNIIELNGNDISDIYFAAEYLQLNISKIFLFLDKSIDYSVNLLCKFSEAEIRFINDIRPIDEITWNFLVDHKKLSSIYIKYLDNLFICAKFTELEYVLRTCTSLLLKRGLSQSHCSKENKVCPKKYPLIYTWIDNYGYTDFMNSHLEHVATICPDIVVWKINTMSNSDIEKISKNKNLVKYVK